MSARAVVVGLIGAAFVAAVTYFNDDIIRQTPFVGNHLPHSVYGLLILFALGLNPLISRLKQRWAFTGGEIAVVLALTLAGCAVPGWGLMKYFPNAMMLPHQKAKTKPSWQAENIIRETPEYMLAGTSPVFRDDDILHPVRICEALSSSKAGDPKGPLRARIWSTLSEEHRRSLEDAARPREGESGDDHEIRSRDAVVAAFNSLLHAPDLYRASVFAGVALSDEAEKILERVGDVERRPGEKPPRPEKVVDVEPRDLRTLNRHVIDAAFVYKELPDDVYNHSKRRHEELYDFVTGRSNDGSAVGISEVPWSAWVRPLVFWLPLFLVFTVGLIGLSLVVHKQWSEHEVLQYPIARFTEALLPGPDGAPGGGILRNRLFLTAAGVVFTVRMLNYSNQWASGSLVSIPTFFDFSSLQGLFPTLQSPVAKWGLFTVRVYPAVVGLGFFLATDVSLSLGIATPISFYIGGLLAYYGISLGGGGGLYSGSPIQVFGMGAYLGLLIMLIYTGRMYYKQVFGSALRLRPPDDAPREAVWGARVFMGCACVMLVYLMAVGVDWILAVPYVLLSFGIFLVLGRIVAMTGLFFLEPRIYPCAFLVVMFGIRAVGPQTALLMFLTSTVLMVIPRESLMPFVVNSLRVLDTRRVKLGRAATWCGVAVLLALVIAVPVTLMAQYGAGANTWHNWAGGAIPRYSFDKAVQHRQRLRAQGALEESDSVTGFARLGRVAPVWESVLGFACGLLIVVGLSAARLRWARWPIHPVIAIGLWNYPATMFYCSFLIAFFIKKTVTKYWGQGGVRRIAPLMVGLIVGDMLAMLVIALVGTVYYLFAGVAGPSALVMPE
ncbi:MAG: DUF6785 family protein [Planctomycetota bacterium]|jgi:hypothetical protein